MNSIYNGSIMKDNNSGISYIDDINPHFIQGEDYLESVNNQYFKIVKVINKNITEKLISKKNGHRLIRSIYGLFLHRDIPLYLHEQLRNKLINVINNKHIKEQDIPNVLSTLKKFRLLEESIKSSLYR